MHVFRKFALLVPLLALAAVLIGLPAVAFGKDDSKNFNAALIGFNETPASINTDGTATLRLKLNADSIDFELTYHNVRALPTQSHIHFGQARTSGGVAIFFCGPAPAKQVCPASTSGSVKGTVTAADVVGPTGQGIAAGDLASVMRAIRGGAAYANLHTSMFPGGEIRGQIQRTDD
jgi:hypothetical protein